MNFVDAADIPLEQYEDDNDASGEDTQEDGDGDGRLENTVVVPRNVWSSLNVLGNIELNDPGEEEEEDENGEGVSSQEEGVSSQEEEDESLAEQPEEMDWDLDI